MNSIEKANIISSDLTKFAGKIGAKPISFFSIIKVTITVSIVFALIMFLVR